MDNAPRSGHADNDRLLDDIVAFCQRVGMAESTFGRRVVNDGKFVSRMRSGGRVTTHTVDRVRAFMELALANRGVAPPRTVGRTGRRQSLD